MAPVYGFCDANCKHEVYTATEVMAILEQIIQGGSLAVVDPSMLPIVAAVKEKHNNENVNFWVGTEAELNALQLSTTPVLLMARIDTNNNLYLCKDDTTLESWKSDVLRDARALITDYATTAQLQDVLTQLEGVKNEAAAAVSTATAAEKTAGEAMPKANFSFNASTGVLDITL